MGRCIHLELGKMGDNELLLSREVFQLKFQAFSKRPHHQLAKQTNFGGVIHGNLWKFVHRMLHKDG